MSEKPKQIIVMRKDLGMRKGKIAAQAAHASMAAILKQGNLLGEDVPGASFDFNIPLAGNPVLKEWLLGAFTKICVYVQSEEELLAIYQQALEAGLAAALIKDNGVTEFGGVPTHTCIAIGPDYPSKLQPITGNLPLF